jgi:hypothetical protein
MLSANSDYGESSRGVESLHWLAFMHRTESELDQLGPCRLSSRRSCLVACAPHTCQYEYMPITVALHGLHVPIVRTMILVCFWTNDASMSVEAGRVVEGCQIVRHWWDTVSGSWVDANLIWPTYWPCRTIGISMEKPSYHGRCGRYMLIPLENSCCRGPSSS